MATFSDLPTIRRLSGITGLSPTGEPQKQHMWEVRVIGGIANQLGDLRFYAKSTLIPQRSVEVIETHMAGRKFTYHGKESSPRTIQLIFWDDQNLAVYNFMTQWMNRINDQQTGASNLKEDITSTINIKLKDTSDLIETLNIDLINSYPTEISDIPLNYESGDPIEIQVSFVFDYQVIDKSAKLGNIKDLITGILQ